MEHNAIELSGLTKRYADFTLGPVNLTLPGGAILGLIGENGAGKTTLIKTMLGVARPDGGTVRLLGQEAEQAKADIGVVLEDCFFYEGLHPRDVGRVLGGVYPTWDGALFESYLNQFGLADKKSIRALSRGMRMKLSLAAALAHRPRLLLLDEATAGLDPVVRDEILDEIAALHREKRMTIILVSHSMEDVARYADRIMVMNHGEKAFDAPPKEVFRHYKELEQIGLAAPQITYIVHSLRDHGVPIADDITTVEEAKEAILELLDSPDKARNGRKLSE